MRPSSVSRSARRAVAYRLLFRPSGVRQHLPYTTRRFSSGRTDGKEESLDALGTLGADFKEEQALGVGERLCLLGRDGALGRCEVELVPGEADDYGGVGLSLEFEDPGFGFEERGLERVGRGCQRVRGPRVGWWD